MPFRQLSVSGFPAVALRSETIEVVCVPAIGMKLTNLRRLAGREWLWRNDQIPLAPGVAGASYVETADSGGWDECFPTVGPSAVPGAPEAGLLPDHGELWSARWESGVVDTADGTTLTGTALGTRFPYEFHRELTLEPDEPVIRIRYRLRHLGGEPFPWIWSSHPLEPCIGAPDRLDQAVDEWRTAHLLVPGEVRQWTLEVRLLEESD